MGKPCVSEAGEQRDDGDSPSERKQKQGWYRAEIYHSGIYRSQNLTVEVWNAERSDSISCIHLEYRSMENIWTS